MAATRRGEVNFTHTRGPKMELSHARYLARIIGDINEKPLPKETIETAKLCFLDFLASSFASVRSSVATSGLVTKMAFGDGTSTVLSHEAKSSLLGASYFNALVATVADLDDSHRFASGLHLSAITFPVAMALGENLACSGERFLKSAIAGYEISSRLSRATDAGLRARGFHASGAIGPFGACAVACVLLDLDENKTAQALSIVASGAGGLFAFLHEGSSVRHVHAATASTNGLQAALMAEQGISGPDMVFEGKDGFLEAYTTNYDETFLRKPPPSETLDYEIAHAYHKIHNSCGHAIPAITGILEIRKDLINRLDQISEINIRAYKASAALTNPKPVTSDEAKFSLPVITGLMIIHGKISDHELSEDIRNHSDVQNIATKVRVVEDLKINNDFPRLRSTQIDIVFSNGETLSKYVDAPLGMPENPVHWIEIKKKFENESRPYLNIRQQERVVSDIKILESSPSISDTIKLLGENAQN